MPYFKSLAQSLYFVGTFTAALLAGMISDWFGRKKAFLIFLAASVVFWFVSYFVDNIYLWLALRFCIGASVMAFAVAASVYGVCNTKDININVKTCFLRFLK
jgi:MFS family permease